MSELSRRDLLVAGGAGAMGLASHEATAADRKAALPQKVLGRTGVKVPAIGLGTAPAGYRKEKEAVAFYNQCIDSGITYLDTAPEFTGYGKAQVYLGQVLKDRRKEVFVVTKCHEPNGDKALALLKKSLGGDFLSGGVARADTCGPGTARPMRRKHLMGKVLRRQTPPRQLSAVVHYLVHCF